MSSLLEITSLEKSFGSQHLFKGISFTIQDSSKIGFLGPNGSGKSTLLKIIMGQEEPDAGSVSRRKEAVVGYASQVPELPSLSVEEVVLQGRRGREAETRARILLGKAQFTDFSQNASLLSGGWKKRLDIVRAMMLEPDLLLLDEPTNHLDLEGITWLESFLKRESVSYVVVSHDRYFLDKIATSVIELNPCYPQGLLSCKGNMNAFIEHRKQFLEAQEQKEASLSSVVRQERAWLNKTPKARTTKSRSRIRKANERIESLLDVKKRNTVSRVDIEFLSSERETRKLLVATNIAKSLGEKRLFSGVDLTLSPGTRVGVVGKNGTGKTTLLKVLAGAIPHDMGTVKYASDLKIVYFDQHREQVSPDITLREALAPNGDMVEFQGQSIHVNGWAKKFLFSPDKLQLPVGCLSGGERARILMAQLMLEPADVLFLDEPTNDLDIPTLEVIEDRLREFPGAVVLISHDRWFMDTVCTHIIGLGEHNEQRLFSSYEQWERSCVPEPKKEKPSSPRKQIAKKKLSYNEQRELDGMEEAIQKQEAEVCQIEGRLAELGLSAEKSLELYTLLSSAQQKLELLFERWEFLEGKK